MSSKLSLPQKQQTKLKLGLAGEKQAAQFLLKQHFQILSRNLRWKQLEVDIIAWDHINQELVFVEVKTRSKNQVAGHLAINHQKMRALGRFARLYVREKYPGTAYRVDAVCIVGQTIDHYRNISWYR